MHRILYNNMIMNVVLNLLFIRTLSSAKVARIGVFGQLCNRQEHILYGMCLDGKCCKRSEPEQVW